MQPAWGTTGPEEQKTNNLGVVQYWLALSTLASPSISGPRSGNSALKVLLVILPKGPTHIPQREPALGYQPHSGNEKPDEDHNSSSEVKRLGLF